MKQPFIIGNNINDCPQYVVTPVDAFFKTTSGEFIVQGRRARTAGTALGVILIAAIVVFINYNIRKHDSAKRYNGMVQIATKKLVDSGQPPLPWDLLAKTKGTFEAGAHFDPELKQLNGTTVTVVGYGIPTQHSHFSMASVLPNILPLFLLGHDKPLVYKYLPRLILTRLPLDCYYQLNPPLHDAMLIQMKEGQLAEVPKDFPSAFQGTLALNESPGRFFFVLKDAVSIEK